jgi:hypothetical protein
VFAAVEERRALLLEAAKLFPRGGQAGRGRECAEAAERLLELVQVRERAVRKSR